MAFIQSRSIAEFLKLKIADLGLLIKFRLSMMVVFSAIAGYIVSAFGSLDIRNLIVLGLGGLLITGSSNALNEVIEKDYDKLMNRTRNRPIAAGRMSVSEAVLWAGLMGLAGGLLLASFNPLTGFLGLVSLVLYAFIYTPLKRISPASVWVGALPGALPILIGSVAASGYITGIALSLFFIQFIWQFPHFWAIAWVADADYKSAGFKLLPSADGEVGKFVGLQCLLYTAVLVFMGILPYIIGQIHLFTMIATTVIAGYFLYRSWQLYKNCDYKTARALMFSSFIYLPVVFILYLIEKLLLS
ncbi:MAG TPA: heme o synthase [Saprospiraceae bacterium]|nr:heme o synthase [Saprospiraceae bacterium]